MNEQSSSLRRDLSWLWMLPLLVLIVGLTARMLTYDLLFVDEYWSIRNAGGGPFGPLSPFGIWQTMSQVDPGGMGIFYEWMLSAWLVLIGTSPFSARLLSLFLGLLTVSLVYRLGRHWFNPRVGLYAAALLGGGAFFIEMSHEARAYTLLTALVCAAMLCYWSLIQPRRPRWWQYGLLALILAAANYTHYIALSITAALGIYHLWAARDLYRRGHMRRWISILGAMFIGGVLYIPWLRVASAVMQQGGDDITRQSLSMDAQKILAMIMLTFGNTAGALVVLAWVYTARRWERPLGLISVWAGVILALVLAVNARIPFVVHPRYLLLIFPALALMTAVGLARWERAGLPIAAVFAVWFGLGVWYTARHDELDAQVFGSVYRPPAAGIHQALAWIKGRLQSDDLVLFHMTPPRTEQFQYFVLDDLMYGFSARYDQFERMNGSLEESDNAYYQDVLAALQEAPLVWTIVVPEVPTSHLGDVTRYALDSLYHPCGRLLTRDDVQLDVYARTPSEPPLVTFGVTDTQIDMHLLAEPLITAELGELILGWSSDSLPVQQYSVAIHVYDAQGQIVAQQDLPLSDARPFGCQVVQIPLSTLAAGDYQAEMVIYNWQTGERLTTPSNADRVPLTRWSRSETGS